MTTSYEEGLQFLNSLPFRDVKPGLKRVNFMLDYLGNPQSNFRSVHVGGSNGKGSVSALISSALGGRYRTGTFVSPPLMGFRDRIWINGNKISRTSVGKLVERLKQPVMELKRDGDTPTLFEAATVLCSLYFAEEGIDIAILESGLGGRYDATTDIGDPLLTVITNIEEEHVDLLGPTREDIAWEIAGLVQDSSPTVAGDITSPELEILEKECEKKDSILHMAPQQFEVDLLDFDWDRARYRVRSLNPDWFREDTLKLGLLGEFQGLNLQTTYSALDILQHRNYPLSAEEVKKGLEKTRWPGRLQVVGKEPYVILDGAHNPSACAVLSEELEKYRLLTEPENKVRVVISALEDKNFSSMVEALTAVTDVFIITCLSHPRARDLDSMEEIVQHRNIPYLKAGEPHGAFRLALENSEIGDIICVTGSLYLVREAISRGIG